MPTEVSLRTSGKLGARAPFHARPKSYRDFDDALVVDRYRDMYAFHGVNLGGRVFHEERFLQAPKLKADLDTFTAGGVTSGEMLKYTVANKNWEIQGTGAADVDSLIDPEGGLILQAHGGVNDNSVICPSLATLQSGLSTVTWGTDQETAFDTGIKVGASITKIVIHAGMKLTSTNVVTTDADGAFWRVARTSTAAYWTAHASINNVDSSYVTPIAVAIGQVVRLRIVIDEYRKAHFLMAVGTGEWVEHWVSGALKNAVDLVPYVGIASVADAVIKGMTLRYVALSRNAA